MNNKNSSNYKVTIYDIAKESGVSYSTVSRVMNGFEFVKDSTRQRVLEAADRLGYVANAQARSLAGGKSNIIGILVPKIDNSYITQIVASIDDELSNANLNLMLYTTHHHVGKEQEWVTTITGGLTDGLLLLIPLAISLYLPTLRERQVPYVLIDQSDPEKQSSEVISTNREGAYEATEYLIHLGHRRIAFISGLLELRSTHERLQGYRDALEDNNIPFDKHYVEQGNFYEQQAYHAANKLLQLQRRPTAIFAANDLTAIGAITALKEHGLSVPQDMSIVGFDDISQAAFMNPRLTTVRQPLDQMGRVGVQLLFERMKNQNHPPRQVRLETELIIRDSCQPLHQ